MSAQATLTVTGGVHAGASVLLPDDADLTVGRGDGADVMLVDHRVEPHHATIRLSNGTLTLTALHEGVSVFGHPLRPDRPTVLHSGAWFDVGGATLQFSGNGVPTPETMRSAELAWLFSHAPLAWLAKRWSDASRGVKIPMIGLLAAGVAAWAVSQLLGSQANTVTKPRLDNPAFRHVHQTVDAKSGARVYDGYVETSPDLARLTATVRSETRAPVMHVIVVEQLREQVASFLEKYYRVAQITPGEPGTFSVTLPPADGYLLPESWDYARVARLARAGVDGLRKLEFPQHANESGPVRVPLESMGLNILHGPHAAWLIDRQGARYFAGARISIGRITRISDCVATVVRDDDGSVYEFFASGAREKKTC